jgi:hypothetical protein
VPFDGRSLVGITDAVVGGVGSETARDCRRLERWSLVDPDGLVTVGVVVVDEEA